jgi:hypothetical protein
MRRLLTVLALVLAGSATASAHSVSTTALTFTTTQTGKWFHEVQPAGDSKGDTYTVRLALRNASRQLGRGVGVRAGTEMLRVVEADAHGNALASGVATFPGGMIRFRFPGLIASGHSVLTAPITGGTGRYAHAAGTVTSTPSGATQTFRVTLP